MALRDPHFLLNLPRNLTFDPVSSLCLFFFTQQISGNAQQTSRRFDQRCLLLWGGCPFASLGGLVSFILLWREGYCVDFSVQ